MLHYAVVFLVIALIAAVFGFGGIAASAVGIAKILFVILPCLPSLVFWPACSGASSVVTIGRLPQFISPERKFS